MLTIRGNDIEYQESGTGPAVLFVPGSYSTAAAWTAIRKRLPLNYRVIATSICGYGGTGETRNLDDFGIEHEVRIVEAVANHAGAPVHLVGHSFGATVALATVLTGTIEILSIATFEANPLVLMRERGRTDLFESTLEMSKTFERAHNEGERDAAGRIIDFWGGTGSFAAMPGNVQDYCRATTFSNVLDWRTAFAFDVQQADLARLKIPALIVRGAQANEEMIAITEGLTESLPNARAAVVDGANHFLITTHAEDCARLLLEFFADVAAER